LEEFRSKLHFFHFAEDRLFSVAFVLVRFRCPGFEFVNGLQFEGWMPAEVPRQGQCGRPHSRSHLGRTAPVHSDGRVKTLQVCASKCVAYFVKFVRRNARTRQEALSDVEAVLPSTEGAPGLSKDRRLQRNLLARPGERTANRD